MQLHFEAMQYLDFLVKDQILHLVSVAKGTRRPAKAEFAALCETKTKRKCNHNQPRQSGTQAIDFYDRIVWMEK